MTTTKRILIGGASGMIGQRLTAVLTDRGYEVVPLVRPSSQVGDGIPWQPADGELDATQVEDFDVWIHLGGENIAEGRWTDAKKKRLHDSRVDSTKLLAETALRLKKPPKSFLCASAVGFYGDRGEETITEESESGTGFLPELGQAWEDAAQPFEAAGVRRVHLRFGIVLSTEGGALAKMITPFKLGLGGRVGSGKQYMSWIHLDDAVAAIDFCIHSPDLFGPVNVVAPNPVTNATFTDALGDILHRPTMIPVPKFAIATVFGEMGKTLLLEGARVIPARLQDAGFSFQYPELNQALTDLLK